MSKNSPNLTKNDNSNNKFEFLTDDFKETGEHLRDTDRKLSVLIQIYTVSFFSQNLYPQDIQLNKF